MVFLGPSGCGKTTLLRIIAGLETQDRGHDRPGRQGHLAPAGDPARLRHRVPVVRAVSEPHDPRQRRVRPRQPAAGPRRDRRAGRRAAEARRPAGLGRQVSRAALGRPAAAHRARARARDGAGAAAARRAAVGARRARARAPARRDPRAAAAPRRDHDHGHARPGRSAVDGRPHRRHERRAHRAGRHAARDLRHRRRRRSWPTSSARSTCCRRSPKAAGASASAACRSRSTCREIAAGTAVKLYLRPEEIGVNANGAAPGQQRCAAKIGKIEFLGAFCMVGIALDAADAPALVANVPRQASMRRSLAPGAAGDREPAAGRAARARLTIVDGHARRRAVRAARAVRSSRSVHWQDRLAQGLLVACCAASRCSCWRRWRRSWSRACRTRPARSSASRSSASTSRRPRCAARSGTRCGSRSVVTAITVPLAFVYAYALTRSCMPGKIAVPRDRADADPRAVAACRRSRSSSGSATRER